MNRETGMQNVLGSQLVFRYAKDALDAVGTADGNLHVSFFEKSGTGIQRSTLDENTLYGINRRKTLILADRMEASNDCAIEHSPKLVPAIDR